MRNLTSLFATTVLLLGACVEGSPPTQQTDPTPREGLTLTQRSPERVAGVYRDLEKGVEVSFDSAREGDRVMLRLNGNGGRHLISIDTVGDTYTMSYMDGRLTMTADRDTLMSKSESDDPATQLDGVKVDGDLTVLDEIMNSPEAAALPWVSHALGEAGITGYDYPAALPIHKMGRQSAEALGVQVPALKNDAPRENGYCTDLRSDPYGNGCYGMCGYGCSCWSWVCGDCCYHNGCAKHDSWCRNGQWYYCYNITAVIALFGC